ncbi:MAG: hypothetical protein LQ348_007382, partial [Seirophora lacunosa]
IISCRTIGPFIHGPSLGASRSMFRLDVGKLGSRFSLSASPAGMLSEPHLTVETLEFQPSLIGPEMPDLSQSVSLRSEVGMSTL